MSNELQALEVDMTPESIPEKEASSKEGGGVLRNPTDPRALYRVAHAFSREAHDYVTGRDHSGRFERARLYSVYKTDNGFLRREGHFDYYRLWDIAEAKLGRNFELDEVRILMGPELDENGQLYKEVCGRTRESFQPLRSVQPLPMMDYDPVSREAVPNAKMTAWSGPAGDRLTEEDLKDFCVVLNWGPFEDELLWVGNYVVVPPYELNDGTRKERYTVVCAIGPVFRIVTFVDERTGELVRRGKAHPDSPLGQLRLNAGALEDWGDREKPEVCFAHTYSYDVATRMANFFNERLDDEDAREAECDANLESVAPSNAKPLFRKGQRGKPRNLHRGKSRTRWQSPSNDGE